MGRRGQNGQSDLCSESIRGPWVPGQASSCSQKGTGIHNQDRRNMAVQGVGAVRHLKGQTREFPGDLVVKTWHFHHCGPSSVPGLGIEIPYQTAAYRSQKKKKKFKGQIKHKCTSSHSVLKTLSGSALLLELSSKSCLGLHWGQQTMAQGPYLAGSLIP